MKLLEFQAFFNDLLLEAAYDAQTSEFARQVMQIIKVAMKDDSKDMYFADSSVKGFPPVRVDIHYRNKDVPLAIAGEYQQGFRNIAIKVLMTRGKDYSKDLAKILPRVKEAIRHELEHYDQDRKGGAKSFVGYQASPAGSSVNPQTDPWRYMEQLEAYYLHPTEVAAYAVGLYKKARMNGREFRDELGDLQDKIRSELIGKGIPEDMINKLIWKIRPAIYRYARKRFPLATPLSQREMMKK